MEWDTKVDWIHDQGHEGPFGRGGAQERRGGVLHPCTSSTFPPILLPSRAHTRNKDELQMRLIKVFPLMLTNVCLSACVRVCVCRGHFSCMMDDKQKANVLLIDGYGRSKSTHIEPQCRLNWFDWCVFRRQNQTWNRGRGEWKWGMKY